MKLIKKRTGVKRLAVCPKCKRKNQIRFENVTEIEVLTSHEM